MPSFAAVLEQAQQLSEAEQAQLIRALARQRDVRSLSSIKRKEVLRSLRQRIRSDPTAQRTASQIAAMLRAERESWVTSPML